MVVKVAGIIGCVIVVMTVTYFYYLTEEGKRTDGISQADLASYVSRRREEFNQVAIGGVRVLEIRQLMEWRSYQGKSKVECLTVAVVQSNSAGKRFFCKIDGTFPAVAGDTWSLRCDDSGKFCLDELLIPVTQNSPDNGK